MGEDYGMIDTHVHLDFPDFKKDFTNVLQRARGKNVNAMICVGIDEASSKRAVEMAEKYPQIWATVGAHPHDAAKVSRNYRDVLKKLLENKKVLAVGETGLDYYRDRSPRDIQQRVFREQIALARETGKPLIIHCRDAYEDMMKILIEEKVEEVGAVLHCYSGDMAFARQSIKMGFFISFSGTVTYPNARQLREVVASVPLENILEQMPLFYRRFLIGARETNLPTLRRLIKRWRKLKRYRWRNFAKIAV